MSVVITQADRLARQATMAAFAIQGLTFASIVTRLPTFKDRLDLGDTDILVLLACVAVMSAVGSLVAGHTAERWGSAGALRWALAGVSVGACCFRRTRERSWRSRSPPASTACSSGRSTPPRTCRGSECRTVTAEAS